MQKSAVAAGLAGIVILTCCRPQTVTGPAPLSPTVKIEPSVQKAVALEYVRTQMGSRGVEYAMCVLGTQKADGTYVAQSAFRIRSDSAELDRIWYNSDQCKEAPGRIGVLHSHPPTYTCDLSPIDKQTFRDRPWMNFSMLACLGKDSVEIRSFPRSYLDRP
jgi:hypothetical protein